MQIDIKNSRLFEHDNFACILVLSQYSFESVLEQNIQLKKHQENCHHAGEGDELPDFL